MIEDLLFEEEKDIVKLKNDAEHKELSGVYSASD